VYKEDGEGVEVLKEIRRLRRKLKGQKRMTFDKIAERLNELGHRNAKGGTFNGASVSMIYHRR
jgi:hypothetical protein